MKSQCRKIIYFRENIVKTKFWSKFRLLFKAESTLMFKTRIIPIIFAFDEVFDTLIIRIFLILGYTSEKVYV